MQKVSNQKLNLVLSLDSDEARRPEFQVQKRIGVSLSYVGLLLTVLVAIFTFNEWFALLIQGLALSGILLPLTESQNSEAVSNSQFELLEGPQPCPATNAEKR